jgi:hypothetical protein
MKAPLPYHSTSNLCLDTVHAKQFDEEGLRVVDNLARVGRILGQQ